MAAEAMDIDVPIPAGWVMEMTLCNFMCHSHLKVDFIKHVNFITGQNGSGKSAILTALCVAFGSKAKGTQRALQLSDFIKIGENNASVEIVLCNEGMYPYQVETYGKRITIVRKVSRSGTSTFELRDCRGLKVCGSKEEVEKLARHFHLDVNNPCVVMSQDKSREFLHSGNNKDKYKLFNEATLLKDIELAMADIMEKLASGRESVTLMAADVTSTEKVIQKLEADIEHLCEGERLLEELNFFKLMYCWVGVRNEETAVQSIKDEVVVLENKLEGLRECIQGLEADKERAQSDCASHKASMGTLNVQRQQKHEEMRRVVEESKQEARIVGAAEGDLQITKNEILEKERKAVALRQQIKDEAERAMAATQSQAAELASKIREARQAASSKNSEIQRLQDSKRQTEGEKAQLVSQFNAIQNKIRDNFSKQDDQRAWLNRVRMDAGNKSAAFGSQNLPSLMRAIEEQMRFFSQPPIGPVGCHVDLLEGKYATAVEVIIGGYLDAFIVASSDDARVLRGIAKRVNYHMNNVVVYSYDLPPIKPKPHEVPDGQVFKTVESVLKINDPVVRNVLIDMTHIERRVLVTDYNEGKAAYDRAKRIDVAVALNGDRMYVQGFLEMKTRNQSNRPSRLKPSAEADIRKAEDELYALEQARKEMEGEAGRIRAHIERLERSLRGSENMESQLRAEKQSTEGEIELLQSQQDEERQQAQPGNLELYHKELEDIEAELVDAPRRLEEAKAVLAKKSVALEDLDSKKLKLGKEIEEILAKQKSEEDTANDLEAAYDHIQNQLAYRTKQKTDTVAELQAKLVELQEKEPEVQQQRAALLARHTKEPSDADWARCDGQGERMLSEHVKMRIQVLAKQNERRRREEAGGVATLSEVQRKKLKAEKKRARHAEHVDFYTSRFVRLQKSLTHRRKMVKRMAKNMRHEIGVAFRTNLMKRGLTGRVIFEEESLALELELPGDGSGKKVQDTRSLSGGERSFATLCFTLALHTMVYAPFRAMDEFDIFMDNLTRKVAMKETIEFAQRQAAQWIFITPHDISSVQDGPKVKRLLMQAPRP
eukprot:TRINITY_DN7435_c0_g1_i2.p1 TRINITY_DN7435_c0_g1~~TRINITY_DN7435_c0_g1_i2.p1  ORF type:complete len:1057 (-),score=240.95 TRINITY_DN7435_c0_g1_i2:990-4160(-)